MKRAVPARIAEMNLMALILLVASIISSLTDLSYIFSSIQHGEILNKISFSNLQIIFNMTWKGYNEIRKMSILPFFIILIMLIYNSYILIRYYISEKNKDLQQK